MKRVHTPEMVAHLFAHQSQDHARNSGNTFYFSGNELFSYGSHFCIAKHIENKKGEKALLFTTRSYSVSTAKHIAIASRACNHLYVIYCNDPAEYPKLNIASYLNKIKGILKNLKSARKPEKYISKAEYIAYNCNDYCTFLGLKFPKEITALLKKAKNGEYQEYLTKEAERILRDKIRKEKKAEKAFKESLIKWRAFEHSNMYIPRNPLALDYLRYNRKTMRVETTQNVQIPLAIAKKAYKWMKDMIKSGGCLGNCDYKILDFAVKSVTSQLFTIGCHTIEISEIETIANELGWK